MNPISHGADWDFDLLERYDCAISEVATEFGLDTYPNQLEIITSEQMLDAYASSGLRAVSGLEACFPPPPRTSRTCVSSRWLAGTPVATKPSSSSPPASVKRYLDVAPLGRNDDPHDPSAWWYRYDEYPTREEDQ